MIPAVIAVTGGTGFVGKSVLAWAQSQGMRIRALARRPQPAIDGVEWIAGALGDADSLTHLTDGADAVLHIAGVTNAMTRQDFVDGNVNGTSAIVGACKASGVKRFIHVSSLSAREPQLSNYGWSKAEAEKTVVESELDWTMVRPPAIFGPGDVDHLDIFKAARFGVVPLPPKGQISVIAVEDLASLLVALCNDRATVGQIFDVDDGRTGGWSQAEFARAIGAAMGRKIIPLHLPASLVRFGARLDRFVRGPKAKLTPDRASYFCHPNWVIDPANRPPAELWLPKLSTPQALTETAAAYRAAGWL